MVYSPSTYLVSAAMAVVALQMQQTAATSLFFDPYTSADTIGTISGKFPARGAEVPDKDCAITVQVDPTLPDIATISTVPVEFPDLLANTTAPTEPVSTKVGTVVLSKPIPAVQEGYLGKATPASKAGNTDTTAPATKTGTITPPAKTGVVTPAPKTGSVQGEADVKDPKDCATGWEESKPTRKLRDSAVSGRALEEKLETKRRLEANANKDIAKLETYFGTKMEVALKNLPTEGVHTPSPWPGPYWPTYQDGINVQWSQGEPSPAEKYATAFGLDTTDFMNKVSKDTGINSMSKRPKCSSDNDCASLKDGSACGIRAGASSGYCIPSWYGICHAWTPAAMLEAEPNCPVTHNGVTFQPMDLKALISDIYDGANVPTVFTGTRFNGGADTTDEYGRHSSAAYRDLNPAYFHIAAANILGKLNATFIADVTAGSEVWNQPVRGFKVYEQTAMSPEEAAQTFYGLEAYPWNAAAKSIVYVKSRLSWIFETYTDGGLVSSGKVDSYTTGAYYYYLLEMDADGNIIGGEWVYDSDDDHPDFIWFPKAKPAADTVTSVGLSYADVSMLLEKSVACEGSSSGSTAAGSAQSSTLASNAASNTGSTGSTAASSTGSNNAATEAPATEAPATETPVSTESTIAAPATTTATPSTNQWIHNTQGSGTGNGNGRGWLSFIHWW
ncbi:hypothetical protein PF002_g8445 [Phytophthora fragariae]|uniref:Transglutaminase elicitor n=2 Tax=Phytophthora fragariae TaxID=53985 RepID=A0A6A4E9D4_9STRA|nr:hypothetical protein PF003_g37535 [Phytophthora fragariae]KAE9018697.1 hypothetical protein PF011_g6143 [Phytophthora fragariae]KAE9122278.1 hypothetical protein PF007_g7497 [Phytophthora fragariae]KAE9148978.1 hypothetical protein PF006_g6482 [Phytophthora fragariae]KAE9243023.1 hypothetical protein PF002_g8445 [Phytophthora fragariae]